MAAVNRIAELLGDEGDPDPLDIRRSKAIGILARPARALELLARHQPETRLRPLTMLVTRTRRATGTCRHRPTRPRRRPPLWLRPADSAARAPHRVALGPPAPPASRRFGRSRQSVRDGSAARLDRHRPARGAARPAPVDGYEIPQAIRDALAARHAGPAGPTGAPAQDVRTPQSPAAGPGGLLLAQPPRLGLAGHQHRHPLPRPRPTSRRLLARRRTEGRTATRKAPARPRTRSAARHRIDLIHASAKAQIILRT